VGAVSGEPIDEEHGRGELFEDIFRSSQREMRLGELYPTVGAVSVGPVLRWAALPKQKQREEVANPFLVLRGSRRRFLTPILEQFLLTNGSFL